MTIRDFADDYIETYGRKMILLAQVSNEGKWQRLNTLYNGMSNMAFLVTASGMSCLIIKHKMLFKPFIDVDCWTWLKKQETWVNVDKHMVIAVHEQVLNSASERYGL